MFVARKHNPIAPLCFSNLDPQALGCTMASKLLERNLGLYSSRIRWNATAVPEYLLEVYEKNPHVLILTLQRPHRKNSLGLDLVDGLWRTFHEVIPERHKDARVLVLRSNVPKVFCSGADLKERRSMPLEEVPIFVRTLRTLFSKIATFPIPTIAAIEGAALGGGMELALSCDLRVAGECSTFALPETKLAILPGAGGTQNLPRLIGYPLAAQMIFTGEKMVAKEAHRVGLVNLCVPTQEAFPKALEMASEISQNGPIAVRAAKEALRSALFRDDTATQQALKMEEDAYEKVIKTNDRIEGLNAFAEGRKPFYEGK